MRAGGPVVARACRRSRRSRARSRRPRCTWAFARWTPMRPRAGLRSRPLPGWRLFVELDGTGDETTIAPLCWEYRTADAWRELAVVDQTYGLQRSGTVGFFGQDDHKQGAEFGVKAFWLRAWRGKCKDVDAVSQDGVSASPDRRDGTASPAQEEEAASPLVAAVRLNVAQATNGVTLLDEVLGRAPRRSTRSSGSPGLRSRRTSCSRSRSRAKTPMSPPPGGYPGRGCPTWSNAGQPTAATLWTLRKAWLGSGTAKTAPSPRPAGITSASSVTGRTRARRATFARTTSACCATRRMV